MNFSKFNRGILFLKTKENDSKSKGIVEEDGGINEERPETERVAEGSDRVGLRTLIMLRKKKELPKRISLVDNKI